MFSRPVELILKQPKMLVTRKFCFMAVCLIPSQLAEQDGSVRLDIGPEESGMVIRPGMEAARRLSHGTLQHSSKQTDG